MGPWSAVACPYATVEGHPRTTYVAAGVVVRSEFIFSFGQMMTEEMMQAVAAELEAEAEEAKEATAGDVQMT